MWEAIESNKRRSIILLALMGIVLVAVGYIIGFSMLPDAAPFGVLSAVGLWIILMAVAFAAGENILMASAGAQEVTREQAPQLFNIVEEMKIAAGLPAMPRVFVIASDAPNAFAVGLKPERAAIAVTTGLLARLNRDELQGVIAHELGHIANRDTLFMTLAGVTLGAVIILTDLFFRSVWISSRGSRRRSRNDGAAALLLIAVVLAIVAPILARLLYFACSRRREFLADASAALFTRYPEGLASALEKISGYHGERLAVNQAVAPMFTVNPLALRGAASLFSTHPPTEERIRVLRTMGGASLAAYESAYAKVLGRGARILYAPATKAAPEQPLRPPSETSPVDAINQWRAAKNLLSVAAGYTVLSCPCGLRIKLPPGFDQPQVKCPRCHHVHDVAALASTNPPRRALTPKERSHESRHSHS